MPPVVLTFAPDADSSDFEEVTYPGNTSDLPLYHMDSEARHRRVGREPGYENGPSDVYEKPPFAPDDGEGKDVYSKLRPTRGNFLGGGRVRQPPPPPPTSIGEFIQQNWEHIPPIIYTLLSCYTRFHKIGWADVVVWDEAHFGKFGSHYLKREFYFDVHPPLGKMLVGLVGLLAGYDGSFEFKSGEKYPDEVPYVAMRVMLATFGVAMVPLGWYTSVELGMSQWACHLTALMVLFDVGWLCISRFILLDSMLLFFTCLVVFCLAKFHNQQWQSFSFEWWFWLSMTGLSIGWVTSVKMVGLFVTSLVGLYTVEDLWEKFGDLRMSTRDQVKHWGARILCLIIIPILTFMTAFKLHFMVLNHSGPGDAQMSSLFQANLVGNDFKQSPLEIAVGSRVTLKNMGWGGGLLHSHVQTFPDGSGQQQVTCYHYKDDNNQWTILPPWDKPEYDPNAEMQFLKSGDVIRLNHVPTTRNLHSHNIPAPVTKLNHEVACYGNATIGDYQDYWVVEVVDDIHRGSKDHFERIHSLTTRLRFKHKSLGCYLRAANAVLPQWGFKQIEVSCIPENDPSDMHTYWNVESHWNDRLPAGNAKLYKSPFLRDFWHLNVAMMTSNNALVPDPDKEDILASNPLDWPFLYLGLRMCGWGDHQIKYYLLGTPIIRWGSSLSLYAALLAFGVYIFRMQRKYVDMEPREWEHFLYVGKIAFMGWFLHYFPFLVMGRVTYVHHYLPTLYFAVIMFSHMLDHFVFSSKRLTTKTKWISFGVLSSAIFLNFWWFRGMAFGMEGPIGNHTGLAWRKTWNIYNH
ncbi:glycosyltransferase family 39 protein [Cylindrobasidium torrendii FP15055 ss-10]|uniref:Dolichyl-phosphate-mannose--protein mannosyltransferase n=1 Tax=Cylindrobasidium torrendii FP15055 ss-10 TaxID=1314674 RepID=A0A0D7BIJ2_9AGAR|nr:glycosyltransferase family 39 protein [Cylindrobasidium torrendii FP15055 ss-10]